MSDLHHASGQDCPLCLQKLTLASPEIGQFYHDVKMKFPDAHISWTYRDKASQEESFAEGKTKLHYPDSAHNAVGQSGDPCSRAIDLFQITEDGEGLWSPAWFQQIEAFNQTFTIPLMWGGKWKSLGDNDHWQAPIEQ